MVGGHDAFSQPGSEVGRYRIIKRLAIGGMAEIYLASAHSLHNFEKLVVLKRILPQYAQNPDFVKMFLDEARLAATLDHPNIATVYDIGEWEESYFFSMEYVHGPSLLDIMRVLAQKRKPLPLEHALNIVVGTCAGLHHAHERLDLNGEPLGIVHRDISPPNVLVTYSGHIKVVDFGIAKATSASTVTNVGTLKGKIPYMSPEQCRADELDRRSDVYSIGIMLYELTVGRRLVQAKTELGIIQQIKNGKYRKPSEVHPHYPPELERAVSRALMANRDHRYQTARDLQMALEDFAREYKMVLSSARLASFMEQVYEPETRRWPTGLGGPPPAAANDASTVRPPPTASGQDSPTRPPATASGQEPTAPAIPRGRLRPATQAAVAHSPGMDAFASALDRILGPTEAKPQLRKEVTDGPVISIDVDALELEDLDPSKFGSG